MPTRRDNAAERSARIEWLLEENRTRTEATATGIGKVLDQVRAARELVRANLERARQRRRVSKA